MRTAVRLALGLALALAVSSLEAAPPTTCPFNIPVVALAPHQVGGYSWGAVVRPLGDPCVGAIGLIR